MFLTSVNSTRLMSASELTQSNWVDRDVCVIWAFQAFRAFMAKCVLLPQCKHEINYFVAWMSKSQRAQLVSSRSKDSFELQVTTRAMLNRVEYFFKWLNCRRQPYSSLLWAFCLLTSSLMKNILCKQSNDSFLHFRRNIHICGNYVDMRSFERHKKVAYANFLMSTQEEQFEEECEGEDF